MNQTLDSFIQLCACTCHKQKGGICCSCDCDFEQLVKNPPNCITHEQLMATKLSDCTKK